MSAHLVKCKRRFAKLCGTIFSVGQRYQAVYRGDSIVVYGRYTIQFTMQEFNIYFCRNRKPAKGVTNE